MSVRADLARFSIHAKKSLGQNFLVDECVLAVIAGAVPVTGESIVEVGPGFGALTGFLATQKPALLDLVELDADMADILQSRALAGEFAVAPTLHRTDVLKWQYRGTAPYRVFGNIPYYVTSPILRHFLYDVPVAPLSIVVLVQKEVADKILCRDGKHSMLSLLVHWRAAKVRPVIDVPAGAFIPAPKVNSAAVAVEVGERPLAHYTAQFLKLISAGFAEKRKQLAGNFSRAFGQGRAIWEQRFQKLGLRPDIRAEDVSLDAWRILAQQEIFTS